MKNTHTFPWGQGHWSVIHYARAHIFGWWSAYLNLVALAIQFCKATKLNDVIIKFYELVSSSANWSIASRAVVSVMS